MSKRRNKRSNVNLTDRAVIFTGTVLGCPTVHVEVMTITFDESTGTWSILVSVGRAFYSVSYYQKQRLWVWCDEV